MPVHEFAAMTLHLGLHTNHRNAEQQQEAREARRLLRERVRDDWDYPALPAWQSTASPPALDGETTDRKAPGGFKVHSQSISEHLEVTEWRDRGYSSSTSEDDGEDLSISRPIIEQRRKRAEVQFDGPDSVGVEISDRRMARRVRRRKDFEEELRWNEGLSHFTARRDVWCGARPARDVRGGKTLRTRPQSYTRPVTASASVESTPRTSTSSTAADAPLASSSNTSPEPATTRSPASARSTDATQQHMTNSPGLKPHDPLLIPVAAQILPNHPIRKRIGPTMYSEIYTKIILQSRTPSVPINLAALIHALIQGWKDDGEWPPKQGPLEKSIGRKKGAALGLKDGVKAVGKILRITSGDSVVKEK